MSWCPCLGKRYSTLSGLARAGLGPGNKPAGSLHPLSVPMHLMPRKLARKGAQDSLINKAGHPPPKQPCKLGPFRTLLHAYTVRAAPELPVPWHPLPTSCPSQLYPLHRLDFSQQLPTGVEVRSHKTPSLLATAEHHVWASTLNQSRVLQNADTVSI